MQQFEYLNPCESSNGTPGPEDKKLRQSLTDIETVPFAGGWLARNLKTGALCRLNATAGTILELLDGGEAHAVRGLSERFGIAPEQARADVDTIIQAWRQSGLIETADGIVDGVTNAGGDVAPVQDRDIRHCLNMVVTCGGPAVRVRCQDAELATLLAAVMAPAEVPDEAPAPERTLDLIGQEGDIQCWRGGDLLWRFGPRPWARRFLLQEVINMTLPCGPASAILHASAVLFEGKVVILAGKSGSGKSTLTAGLVAAGGQLIADDLLPLADGHIWPVPFAISVKQGSWPVLAPLFAGFDDQKVFTSRGMKVRYLAPTRAMERHSVRPAAIFFPAWDKDIAADRQALDANAVADGLIETGTDLRRVRGALGPFAELSSSADGYRIFYPTLAAGITLVSEKTGTF